jgi:hypothetical protein
MQKPETHLMYWPKKKQPPEGWRVVCDMQGIHHGKYSVLIEKDIPCQLADLKQTLTMQS